MKNDRFRPGTKRSFSWGYIYTQVRKPTFLTLHTRQIKLFFYALGRKMLFGPWYLLFSPTGGGSPPRASQKKRACCRCPFFFLTGPWCGDPPPVGEKRRHRGTKYLFLRKHSIRYESFCSCRIAMPQKYRPNIALVILLEVWNWC